MYGTRTASRLSSNAVEATVTRWVPNRGFEFCRLAGGRDLFIHVAALHQSGLGDCLDPGQRIRVEIDRDRQGRERAAAVELVDGGRQESAKARLAREAARLWVHPGRI
jgi:cold shock CspA family protein